jgi:hypothetical protein
MLQSWMIIGDLAPGDSKSATRDWSEIVLHRVESRDDPMFDMAFGALWSEFGEIDEIEQPDVLAARMLWDPRRLVNGCALKYRMMLITAGGRFVAVRDHTAIVVDGTPGAVVHLSHNLVAPEWRRSGVAGWLRALPIQTARNTLAAQGRSTDEPITLVGEMEHPDESDLASMVRLKAYERAGYRKVDPSRVNYLQPDFRPTEEIDLTGRIEPIPMAMIVRRVGRESEETIPAAEVRAIATALYRMYAMGFRARDMEPLFASLENYPNPEETLALVPPLAPEVPA